MRYLLTPRLADILDEECSQKRYFESLMIQIIKENRLKDDSEWKKKYSHILYHLRYSRIYSSLRKESRDSIDDIRDVFEKKNLTREEQKALTYQQHDLMIWKLLSDKKIKKLLKMLSEDPPLFHRLRLSLMNFNTRRFKCIWIILLLSCPNVQMKKVRKVIERKIVVRKSEIGILRE